MLIRAYIYTNIYTYILAYLVNYLYSYNTSGIATPNAADTEFADCPASVCSGSAKHACSSTVNLQDEDCELLDGMD